MKKKETLRISRIVRTHLLTMLLLFTAVLGFYTLMFLDTHARIALQHVLTRLNGAEVNIGRFESSIRNFSVELADLQFTDKRKPDVNSLQIDLLHGKLNWDALLRAKVVVDTASVRGIGLQIKRRKPGYVLPVEDKEREASSLSAVVIESLNQYLESATAGTFFNDLLHFSKDFDAKKHIDALQAQFIAPKSIQETFLLLRSYRARWEEVAGKFEEKGEYRETFERVRALSQENIETPQEAVSVLQQAQSLKAQIDQQRSEASTLIQEANLQVTSVQKGVENVRSAIRRDIALVESKMQIPKLNSSDMTSVLFGRLIGNKLDDFFHYYDQFKRVFDKYQKNKAEDKSEDSNTDRNVPKRQLGENVEFAIRHVTYPMFWMRKLDMSVYETGRTEKTIFAGEVTELSSSPQLVREPTTFSAKGFIPNLEIENVSGKAIFDHRVNEFKETIEIDIGHIPLRVTQLFEDQAVKVGMPTSALSLKTQFEVNVDSFSLGVAATLTDPRFDVAAENANLQRILAGVLGHVSQTDLNVRVGGPWLNPSVQLTSGIGRALSKSIRQQFNAEVAQAKQRVNVLVRSQVQRELDELISETEKAKRVVENVEQLSVRNFSAVRQELETVIAKVKDRGAEDLLQESKRRLNLPL